MSERKVHFEIPRPGGRLDVCLVDHLTDLSRTRLQQLIRNGLVRVNGVAVHKPSLPLQGGEWVEVLVPAPQSTDLIPEAISLDIVFENEDLIVVNKPAGMVVHPSAGHGAGTLVHAALAHAPDMEGVGGEVRPGVVHRLDRETSGLIIMAKNDRAHRALQRQFKERRVEKTYLALVHGQPPTPEGRIEAPIGRDPRHRKRMAVVQEGKGREAITTFHTLERFPDSTLLEIHPLTGRTHQIRLHLAFLGCPVVGDTLYGHKDRKMGLTRQFLHASALRLTLPGEQTAREFEAALPADLHSVLRTLRQA